MDAILDMLFARGEHLLDRFSGPLNFRLVVMPLVVSFLALRAHWKDVREGRPTIFGAFVTDPVKRRRLFRQALKDARADHPHHAAALPQVGRHEH